jgi:MtN3 and saliva related transmembrane protein
MGLVNWLGLFAAACTTLSFVPQIVKIRKQGGGDLSFYMLFIYWAGVLFWFAYGLKLHAQEIIWANGVSAVLVAVAIGLKATHPDLRAASAAAAPREVAANHFRPATSRAFRQAPPAQPQKNPGPPQNCASPSTWTK